VIEAVGTELNTRFREGERVVDRVWAILGKYQLAAIERNLAGGVPGLRVSYRFGAFHLTRDAPAE
jgi:hypothetical protein